MKIKMKLLKRLIIIIILAVMVVGIIAVVMFGVPGYKMYKEEIEKNPLEQKISSIKEKKNYYSQIQVT